MKTFSHFRAHCPLKVVLALTFATAASSAIAQLRLPSLTMPVPQGLGSFGGDLLREPGSSLGRLRELPLVKDLRLGEVSRLLKQHRDVLEADPHGEPVVRRELLAWNPSTAGLAAAAAAGLVVLRERRLDGLDETIVVLGVPGTAGTAVLLEQLRRLDPEGSYDFNHVYTGSGAAGGGQFLPRQGAAGAKKALAQVGLIDSGIDAAHAVFRDTTITRWGCGDTPHPDQHGTAVAALMVGKSEHFRGVAPQATLFAADVYCNSGTGGSADKIAAALAWLARENVGVINMSIVGPPNQTLERVIGAMVRRGHLLVAAVGNDGPAAPPLYPASYPGVVGVSAVDKRGRAIPEAGRGRQVMFAAPGNNMVSAAVGAPPYRQVRGTSFASPIVAAMLAPSLTHPDKAAAALALSALSKQATRTDASAISNETGLGVVGQDFRVDPSELR